jgi:thiol-disulfide isomerase/thioredoxin
MRREVLAAVAGLSLLVPGRLRAVGRDLSAVPAPVVAPIGVSNAGEGAPAESVHLFRDMTFDAALKEAAARKKIVMVDFYTSWCDPCKRMDLTTWRDPAVASFLNERAISLRIDAMAETKLAERYRVRSYPTMLLLRPDGTEIDQLSGFLTSDQFLADFKDALAGKTALQRARAAVAAATARGEEGEGRRANARKDLAGILAQRGDSAEALKEYLWLYDDGMKKLPAFAGVRSSYVLMEIKELGKDYPPALAALRERRDAARKRLEAPGFVEDDGRDYSALNWILWETTATMKFFDSLPAGDPRRHVLGYRVFDELLKSRRYAEAADQRPAERVRADFDQGAKDAWGPDPESDAEMIRMNREFQMRTAAEGLEALAGAGKLDDARELIRRMLAVEDAPWVRAMLREHLARAGREDLLGPA